MSLSDTVKFLLSEDDLPIRITLWVRSSTMSFFTKPASAWNPSSKWKWRVITPTLSSDARGEAPTRRSRWKQ